MTKLINNIIINYDVYMMLIIIYVIYKIIKKYNPKIEHQIRKNELKKQINKLSKKEYKILKDVKLNNNIVDYVLISKSGIYMINLLNYDGIILGQDNWSNWINYEGKNKNKFNNPINNLKECTSLLSKDLGIEENKINQIICIPKNTRTKINTSYNIIKTNKLLSIINKSQNINYLFKKYDYQIYNNIKYLQNQ